MKPLALEKEMFERMGFTNFTTKWQKIQEEQEEVDNDMNVKEEYPSFRLNSFIWIDIMVLLLRTFSLKKSRRWVCSTVSLGARCATWS